MSASYGATIDPVLTASSMQIETSLLDALLADTPPFAIGLLGFAVFTFFLISKKINLAILFLFSSVLLVFFGALADLGQLYLRHAYPSSQAHPSLAIIREVLYSISSGLRFLFYWVFVSQPPFCEKDSAPFLSVHSGSWQRWGITGSFLRWATLAASLSVLVFQVLWRIVPLMHEFGPVYDIEGAVEITTSAIFIIKLLLNVLLVEVSSRRQTLWQYSSVFSALSINMAIGIGNLMHFAFSEITLGRLLLVTEFQILVVSTMVFAFYSPKTAEGSTHPSSGKRASSFRGLNLSFYETGPRLFDPNRTSRIQPRRPSAQSISSWLARDAQSRPPSQFGSMLADEKRLGAEKRERALSAYPSEKTILSFAADMVPDSAQSSARWDGPVYPSSIVNSFVAFPLPPAFSDGPSSPVLAGQFSVGSTYNARKASSPSVPEAPTIVPTGPDSPVLGSDGIDSAHRSSPPLRPLSNDSSASYGGSDYDHLFREQIELERSIAALRESTPFGRRDESQDDRDTNLDLPERGMTRESSTTGNGHTSTSGKSEFSLSIFPEPPEMREFEEGYRQSSSSSVLLPPRRLSTFTAGQGFPTSNRGSEDGTTLGVGLRELSVGTHYDVTSFIGDLSSPIDNLAHTPAQPDTDSEPGSAVQATIVTVERKTSIISRPRLVTSPSLAIGASTSAVSRGRGSDGPSTRDMETPVSRQFPPISALLVSPPPAIYTRGATTSPRTPLTKRVVGLPSRPSPLADRRIGDVLDKPAPKPAPM